MNPTGKEILDSDAYKRVSKRLEEELVREFQRTAPNDTEGLSGVAYKLVALRDVHNALQRELRAPINLHK